MRGAPAIAIAAALSLVVELAAGGRGAQFASAAEAAQHVTSRLRYLETRWEPGSNGGDFTGVWMRQASGAEAAQQHR